MFLVFYGVYTEGGAFASKNPVDAREVWVSKIDLDLVPPPLSVASLKRSIALNEGITAFSQLFFDKATMTPLCDDHVLTEDDWLGSTADDHIIFKFDTQSRMVFDDLKHGIQNCSTGRVMALSVDWALRAGSLHLQLWSEFYASPQHISSYPAVQVA